MGPPDSTRLPLPEGDVPPTAIKVPSGTHRPETPSMARTSAIETPPSRQQAAPHQVGRYVVGKRIGAGGFADVYAADDPELHRTVVIKIPRHDRASSSSVVEEFIREARTAAKLQHSHIVTIHDVGRTDEQGVFIAMEHLAGGTLAQRMGGKPMPVCETLQILADVADAVHYAHKRELVHRDLKPSNILFTSDGTSKVSDFGLAIHESAQVNRRGEVSGTPAYMSPEQVRGETHFLDGRSDIWSLGVILYECLTGKLPFHGTTTEEIYEQIQHRDPKPLRQLDDSIPPELDELCRRCLRRDPKDRPVSAHELSVQLRSILKRYSPRPALSKRWATAIALLLVAAAGIAILLTSDGGSYSQAFKGYSGKGGASMTAGALASSSVSSAKPAGEEVKRPVPAVAPVARLDDWEVGRWNSLLTRPPRVLQFHYDNLTNNHLLDKKLGYFSVNTTTQGVFAFAEDVPSRFEVRLAVKYPQGRVGTGIFWGLQEHDVDDESPDPALIDRPKHLRQLPVNRFHNPALPFEYKARAVHIPVWKSNSQTVSVYLQEVTLHHVDRERLYVRSTVDLDEVVLAIPRNDEATIGFFLVVDGGRCTELSIDDIPVSFDVEEETETLSCVAGEFGLIADRGQLVVTDFSVRPLNPNP